MTNNREPDGLFGIKAIAKHVGMTERQALYRVELGQMPTFKMGRAICASRSALDGWLRGSAATRKLAS